jgi:hypothetical protein
MASPAPTILFVGAGLALALLYENEFLVDTSEIKTIFIVF